MNLITLALEKIALILQIFNNKNFKLFKFNRSIKNITFIGGGDIMLQAIKIAKLKNINPTAYFHQDMHMKNYLYQKKF